jgi:hypothetical protein
MLMFESKRPHIEVSNSKVLKYFESKNYVLLKRPNCIYDT